VLAASATSASIAERAIPSRMTARMLEKIGDTGTA
jgi:hypothetical protein